MRRTTRPEPHWRVRRQYLQAGALEEIRLHLVPTILGAGTRLFDDGTPPNVRLQPTTATNSPRATHITYRALRAIPTIGPMAESRAPWYQ